MTYQLKPGQKMADAFDVVRAQLEDKKVEVEAGSDRAVRFARYPEWRDQGDRLIAILPYDEI